MSHFVGDGPPTEGSVDNLPALLQREGTTWVELFAPTDEEFDSVNRVFHWHPLAIDDLRIETHLPKVDDFGDHLLLVVHAVALDERRRFDTAEIEIFVGRNYLVTHHTEPVKAIEGLIDRCRRNPSLAAGGPAYLLYLLLDGMADVYLPYLDELDDRIDEIEEGILDHPTPETLGKIYGLKRDVISIRRVVLPQADVVRRLSRGEFPILPGASAVYFRDIDDHLFRISEEANSYRDLLTGALDSYLSAVSNNMNQVMKVLTVFASIFIPLTFIAGIWGMNFEHMPELNEPWGYAFALGTMAVVGIFLAGYFRRRGWM